MNIRTQHIFLALILTQIAHSSEEYIFRLYDVFAPARIVSGLISNDLSMGFVIVNVSLICFGLWCYAARVRKGHPSAQGLAWFWSILEFGNGTGHLLMMFSRGEYVPGVVTAVPLLILSIIMGIRLIRFTPNGERRITNG